MARLHGSETVCARRFVALECELHQPVDQLHIGDPTGPEQRPVDAGLRETGHRVELVEQHGVADDEEVNSRQTAAAGVDEGFDRELADAVADRGRAPSRTSPGSEAIGSSLPSTEHSTSRPSAAASTIATESWASAVASAPSSCSISTTREIPTDEPSRAGLTTTGRPSEAIRSRTPAGVDLYSTAVTASYGTCGIPACAISCLNTTLCMHWADASTPAPT